MTTPWSGFDPDTFLREGGWASGQGTQAPDRVRLREILTELEPCTLLDVGCGGAIELDGILEEGLQVTYTGMDLTPEFVLHNRAKHPSHAFLQGDVLSLSASRGYDVVSCRAVLDHLDDGERALQHLYDAAKQMLVVSFFIPPAEGDKVWVSDDGFLHHQYDLTDWVCWVGELGASSFRAVRHNTENRPWQQWEMWR